MKTILGSISVIPTVFILVITTSFWYWGELPNKTQIAMDTQVNRLFGPSLFLETRIRTLSLGSHIYDAGYAACENLDLTPFKKAIETASAGGKNIASVDFDLVLPDDIGEGASVIRKGCATALADKLGRGFSASAWDNSSPRQMNTTVFIHW